MRFLLQLMGLDQARDVHRLTEEAWQTDPLFAPWVFYTVLAMGAVLALVNFLPRLGMRPWVRVAVCLLRLGMVGVVLVVLGGVEWQVGLELNEKQRWTVLVDDSASMATRDVDEQTRYAAALADLEKLRAAAEGKVQLSVETFSGAPGPSAEPGLGPTLFEQAVTRAALSHGQVDRLVLLTDGQDSERRDLARLGEDLQSRAIGLSVRLYGSTVPPSDRGLWAEPERNVLRLGEELVVRGQVTGNRAGDEEGVSLKEDGKPLRNFSVALKPDGRFEIRHRPKQKGQHVYTLALATSDAAALNNSVSFAAQVVEEKINVLLVEGFPRFEFKFFKVVLEVDPLVSLVSVAHLPGGGVYVQGTALHRNPDQGLITAPAELFKYDVVVLRDVPRSYFRTGGDTSESRLQNLVQFVTKRGGGLMVLGGQDVYRAGGYQDSPLAPILPFDLSTRIANEDQFPGMFYVTVPKSAYEHPLLQLVGGAGTPTSTGQAGTLVLRAENRERLHSLRQLDGSNNVGGLKPAATPLLMRTVKVKGKGDAMVDRETPVLASMAVGEGKVLAASVDTFWRWQLQPDFDDPPLTMLLANAVRFLAPPPGRKPGQPNVALNNSVPQVGQEVELATDLRDANYDPLQERDLVVTVERPDGTSYRMYPRDLPEEPGHYVYRVLLDQPGPYKVTARYDKFEAVREFLAGTATGEFADLSADRPAMERLAKAAGGEVVPADFDAWLAEAGMAPAHRPAVRTIKVWNSPLVLVAFLTLLCVDCYLRKRQGLV